EAQTREFTVRRGDNPVLVVKYEPRAVAGAPNYTEHLAHRLPDGPPGSPLKYLGYTLFGSPDVKTIANAGEYTNVILVPAFDVTTDQFLDAARRAGLTTILTFFGERREGVEDQLRSLIRKHRDIVAGVDWLNPYSHGYSQKDVALFGQWLKREFPGLQ